MTGDVALGATLVVFGEGAMREVHGSREAAATARGLVWVATSLVVGIGCYRSAPAPEGVIDLPDGGAGDPLDVDEPLDEPPVVPADPADAGTAPIEHPCPEPVDGPVPPLSESGRPVRWDTAHGCVPVSYDPILAGLAPEIAAALEAWEPSCSALCFGAPFEESVDVDLITQPEMLETATPRLHFMALEESGPVNATANSRVVYATDSGEILFGLVQICTDDCPSGGAPTRDDFIEAMSRVLLLTGPTADEEHPSRSELDALCGAYPDPNLC